MNIPNTESRGIGAKSRTDLAKILQMTGDTLTAKDVVHILGWTPKRAANWLAYLERKGWLCRVKRGLYISVSLEAKSKGVAMENPWAITDRLFSPCYISGWSAAQYWGFTDQIYESVVVITAKHVNRKTQEIGGTKFYLKMMDKQALFGTKAHWTDHTKVWVADPSRLIIDLCNDPHLGGGIRNCAEIFLAYLRSEHYLPKLLMDYGERRGNRTAFKRLGFLAEKLAPENVELIDMCKARLSKGYSQLDPAEKGNSVVKRWKLQMPKAFKQEKIVYD